MPAGQYKISINDLSYQFSYYYYNTDSQGKVEYVYREEDTVERNFENNGYLTIRRKDKEPFKSREDIIKAINAVTIERVVKGVIPCGKSEKKKRIVFLGDSTIGMERGDTSIPEIVAQLSRDVCYNCAMGGTRATQHEDYWKYYDFEEIANSIANSDFSNQNKYLSKEDIPKYFADVIAANSSLWMIDGDQSHPNVNGREMFARYIVKILSGM